MPQACRSLPLIIVLAGLSLMGGCHWPGPMRVESMEQAPPELAAKIASVYPGSQVVGRVYLVQADKRSGYEIVDRFFLLRDPSGDVFHAEDSGDAKDLKTYPAKLIEASELPAAPGDRKVERAWTYRLPENANRHYRYAWSTDNERGVSCIVIAPDGATLSTCNWVTSPLSAK